MPRVYNTEQPAEQHHFRNEFSLCTRKMPATLCDNKLLFVCTLTADRFLLHKVEYLHIKTL